MSLGGKLPFILHKFLYHRMSLLEISCLTFFEITFDFFFSSAFIALMTYNNCVIDMIHSGIF